jgi:hypothetical protein
MLTTIAHCGIEREVRETWEGAFRHCSTNGARVNPGRDFARPYRCHLNTTTVNSVAFLASAGLGREIIELRAEGTLFCQGDTADLVYYMPRGRERVTVASQVIFIHQSRTLSPSLRLPFLSFRGTTAAMLFRMWRPVSRGQKQLLSSHG